MKNFNDFKNSPSLNYLKSLYNDGAISTDVYEITLSEDKQKLLSFDNLSKKEIKIKVLNFLYDTGAISTDVYEMELNG